MQWFKHDTDAHRDAKLKRVVMKYGMEGYGLYWHCIELIAANISTNNLTFELEHDAEIIAHDTGIHYELVQEMVTYMVNLGLFENSQGTITCMKLAKRLDQSMTSNTTLRQKINNLRLEGHDGVMTVSGSNHDNVMKEQNRSDKKRTDKKRHLPESEQEVVSYFLEKGYSEDAAKRFFGYYNENDWCDGKGNPVNNWKSKANAVWFKPENKQANGQGRQEFPA